MFGTFSGAFKGTWSVRYALLVFVLLLVVAVPAVCVLWFMNEAIGNERLAVRQRLAEVYTDELNSISKATTRELESRFRRVSEILNIAEREHTAAPCVFQNLVDLEYCDSVCLFDANGRLVYPMSPEFTGSAGLPTKPGYVSAWRLEYELSQPREAIDRVYARFAAVSDDPDEKTFLFRHQVRCLIKDASRGEALELLTEYLDQGIITTTSDFSGRLIAPQLLMLGAELSQKTDMDLSRKFISEIQKFIIGVGCTKLPTAQKIFLYEKMSDLDGLDSQMEKLYSGELLAQRYLDSGMDNTVSDKISYNPDLKMFTVSTWDRRAVLLFDSLPVNQNRLMAAGNKSSGVKVYILPENERGGFVRVKLSKFIPDYVLAVDFYGDSPLEQASKHQRGIYVWAATAGILIITVLAATIAGYVGRQIKLTRLKNDLIATVSHELKTPLASMRLLVDTLQAGRTADAAVASEYLHMISRENERLTRLIDNFLTFSRMERNKRVMRFDLCDINDIVSQAVCAVSDRFDSPQCKLEIELPENSPVITADAEAMVSVLVNLLDNAWKYSNSEKVVHLKVWQRAGEVCLEVSDNGIGMTRRAMRHIFERFYQADNSLSRDVGGCGLGLSIVKFIVDSHGGRISVSSRPGRGSSFVVTLPADA